MWQIHRHVQSHWYSMLDFVTEAEVLFMQREDLWMIVDDIYKPALLFTCHFNCSPHIKLERQAIYFCLEVKFSDSTSGLGPKDGFSLEAGGSVLGVTVSTCSDLTLMELGATGEKDIWMLSPSLSMLALCSISLT